jgi:hypothetical protein
MDAPQLVTTEIPEEVARMEAALQRERQERAATAARDAQIAAAINNDLFFDAEPVSMGAPISITGAMSTPLDILDDVKDIDVDIYSNKEVIDQNKENYNIEISHSRDHRGKHYWCFDDRHAMPFVIIAFRTRQNKWLCIINDNIMPLSKFLSISEVRLGAQQRREFGAPATAPTLRTLICKTSTGEELTFHQASVGHIMAALQTISEDPDADYEEEHDDAEALETIKEVDGDVEDDAADGDK